MAKKLFLLLAAATVLLSASAKIEVTNLRTIGLQKPIGIESNPAFSWELSTTERNVRQSAYQIVVADAQGTNVWNSGRVESNRQTDVPYEGAALQNRMQYTWTVTVFDQDGLASEEAQSTFETGILTQDEWSNALWIAPKALPYKAIQVLRVLYLCFPCSHS